MKTLFIALIGFFLSVTLTGAEEPTTAPSKQMIVDVKNASVEIAGKVFALGTSADALVAQLGKPDTEDEDDEGGDVLFDYMESLGFSAIARDGKLNEFHFFLRRTPERTFEHAPANVKTIEGIGVNSTREQIEKAYGKPDSVHGTEVVFLTYGKTTFGLDKDGLKVIFMMNEW